MSQDTGVGARSHDRLLRGVCAGMAITVMIFLIAIGPRPDIGAATRTFRFLIKFGVTGALAVSAVIFVFRVGLPGASLRPASWALLIAPMLLLGSALTELAVTPRANWHALMVGENSGACLTIVPLLSIAPLACILAALRGGAPARPGLAGAVAGLAASGVAATFYAANCVDDSPLFVIAWYPPAVALVAGAGFLAGRKVLRW